MPCETGHKRLQIKEARNPKLKIYWSFQPGAYSFLSKTLEWNSAFNRMFQCSTPNPKEMRQEAGMKSTVRPDTTLNGSIRILPGLNLSESTHSQKSRWEMGAVTGWHGQRVVLRVFGEGGRSRAFTLSAVTGMFQRFLEVWRRVLICQIFGPYTSTVCRVVLWNVDVRASAPHSVIAGFCQNKRKASTSIYSMEYWDEWKQHTPNFQQYA